MIDKDTRSTISQLTDLLAGDMDVYKNRLQGIDLKKIKLALDFLLDNPELSSTQKAILLANSWRVYYRAKPPSPEEFLTDKYLGSMAENIYPRVKKWFLEFWDDKSTYRNAVLYPFIGAGKALRDDQLVITPKGSVPISKLKLGDLVCTPDGKSAPVTGVFPQGNKKDLYNITMGDGRSVIACGDHLWNVTKVSVLENSDIYPLEWNVLSTQQLFFNKKNNPNFDWCLPLTSPVQYEEQNHIISPFDLGQFLIQNQYNFEIRKTYNENYITNEYLFDSIENRVQLLNGLIYPKEFSLKSSFLFLREHNTKLANSIVSLVRSLGGISDFTYSNNYIKLYMQFYSNSSENILKIFSITPSPPAPATCITVDHPDKLFLANDFIVTHNSTVSVLMNLYSTVHLALMRNPKKYFGLAPSTNLAYVLCSYNLTKAQETLLEPFINILDNSDYFERARTREDMVKREKDYQQQQDITKLHWTTASRNGIYVMQFSNGLNYKLASSPSSILGLTIVMGTMTELAFFREAGKSLSMNSKIYTPDGFTLMKYIKIGDKVFTPNGDIASVTGVFPQGYTQNYDLKFHDGRIVTASKDHLWKVSNIDNKQSKKYEKDVSWDILSTEEMFNQWESNKSRFCVPMVSPIPHIENTKISLDPFILGKFLKQGMFPGHGSKNYPKEIKVLFEKTGFHNLHIPLEYLYGSLPTRWKLLRGLTSIDFQKAESKNNLHPFFSSSKHLLLDVMELTRGLGGYAFYSSLYTINIVFPVCSESDVLPIRSISPLKVHTETQCITIDHPGKLFVTDGYVATHNSDNYIMRFFNDMKGRVRSRFKDKNDLTGINYWGRTILDSSPNDLDSPVDKYCMFEADRDPLNYVIKGSQWQWVPEDYEPEELEDKFPIYKGGNGKPPIILSSSEGYELDDIIYVPRKLYQLFHDDLIKSLKDWGGIPQGNLDKLFYDYEKIENIFISKMKGLYSCIKADTRDSPTELIWNQIKDEYFVRAGKSWNFYYKPSLPRVFHIDQSISGDMTAIAFVHVERKFPPGRGIDLNLDRDLVYVVDMVIPIHPFGGRINLDAVKLFIEDCYTRGNIPIYKGSYDTYQSEPSIQYLNRLGIEMENVSVDETTDPYMFLAQLIEQGNLKVGKNIILKNNLKSLRMTKRKISGTLKIDHTLGDTISPNGADYTWETSTLGLNAKDCSDAVAGAVTTARQFLAVDGQSLSQVWEEDKIVLSETQIKEKVQSFIEEIGFSIGNVKKGPRLVGL